MQNVASLRTIDGKLRLHGRSGGRQIEVTLPTLTTQCEQTIQNAISTNGGVDVQGKGRVTSDNVPGYGYVTAYDLADVSTCVTR